MATAFDPVKAQREIVAGVLDVYRVLQARARHKEREMAEVTDEYNALAKIERFAADLIERERRTLRELEENEQLKKEWLET